MWRSPSIIFPIVVTQSRNQRLHERHILHKSPSPPPSRWFWWESVLLLRNRMYVGVMTIISKCTLELEVGSRVPSTLFEVSTRNGLHSFQISICNLLLLCGTRPNRTWYNEVAAFSAHRTCLARFLQFVQEGWIVRGSRSPASNTFCKGQLSFYERQMCIPRQKAWSQLTKRPYLSGVS